MQSAGFKVILPKAPVRKCTANQNEKMPCWFNFSVELVDALLNAQSSVRINFIKQHMNERAALVTELIKKEVKILGKSERVFVGGYD